MHLLARWSCAGWLYLGVLLQFSTTPGSHGSVKFFYARIADISMGVTLTSAFTVIMPW